MKITIEECISDLQEDIQEKQAQIELLESLDFTKPVTEERWHELCETPLRNSDLLGVLIQNIFPDAENIQVHCNYVCFDLYGFKVQVPTSRRIGINIDLSWWHRDRGEPEALWELNNRANSMRQYFIALDEHKGWYECAKLRLGNGWRKWVLFLMWWFKYKWKDPHREKWEKHFEEIEDLHNKHIVEYYNNRAEINGKVGMLINILLPEVENFSKKHYSYDGDICQPDLDQVIANEKLVDLTY